MLPVLVLRGGTAVGRVAVEVRSQKLDYLKHYQWMLEDIADQFASAVLERFAPTEQRLRPDEVGDAETLYQRFAFLRSLIEGDEFQTAIRQVLARPHRAWVEEEELHSPAQGLRASSSVARQIVGAPGSRTPWPGGRVDRLPARMQFSRTEETLDTPENRFIKFVLTQWRELVAEIGLLLEAVTETGPVARGLREIAAVVDQLDALLSADLLRDMGPMTRFPAGSQVLQKKAGYREIFRAYVQVEAAAALTWKGGLDVFGAGQRNVATLYEYWVFLQLAALVKDLCTDGYTEGSLFTVQPGGLTVSLQQGRELLVTGVVARFGRRLQLDLCFNRTFSHAKGPSWTVPMRPDVSLRIRPERDSPAPFPEVWVHFDWKYRIEETGAIFGLRPGAEVDEQAYLAAVRSGTAKRDDLLKMHAYRDAIRSTAGSFVIYPGQADNPRFTMYHEILPGLGAFALRPANDGEAAGTSAIRAFLTDMLDHLASQASQHERERYWFREAYDDTYRVSHPVAAVPRLNRPPADTLVLTGYVRSQAHLDWIHTHGLYNMRATGRRGGVLPDSRELAAQFVLLFGPRIPEAEVWQVSGRPQVFTEAEMKGLVYPRRPLGVYYCLGLTPLPREYWPQGLSLDRIQAIRDRTRPHLPLSDPLAVPWLDLVR